MKDRYLVAAAILLTCFGASWLLQTNNTSNKSLHDLEHAENRASVDDARDSMTRIAFEKNTVEWERFEFHSELHDFGIDVPDSEQEFITCLNECFKEFEIRNCSRECDDRFPPHPELEQQQNEILRLAGLSSPD